MNAQQRRAKMMARQMAGITDPRVLAAIGRVPRHCFVPADLAEAAYDDRPLPIGRGQTISQPFMVAWMTQALEVIPGERVLEVGTGSGYQTAVLCELGARVCTVERIEDFSQQARRRLRGRDVHFHVGDGTLGVPEEAPFDAIIVTAGSPSVPPSLTAQLRPDGGRMVIPVGNGKHQELLKVRPDGVERLGGCRFVRLIGREGWADHEAN